MAYGSTTKKDDTYGMLLTIRAGSAPPILHWKCRLPEPRLTGGLLVSPCGTYTVGGGSSGTIYLWRTLGGTLIRPVKAHYRSVTVMEWTPCGRHLATGGADGMVHVFSMLDLVEQQASASIQPIRTWSKHHLPVTALTPLTSGRMASAAEDGQVVVMEVFSEETLATIQMPHAIRVLTSHDHRLFCGDKQGSVYIIDLDEYAMQKTAQLGATIKRRNVVVGAKAKTATERVFGGDNATTSVPGSSAAGAEAAYTVELTGHDRGITALAFLEDRDQEWLVSGDEVGVLRIWDLESLGCVRTIQPWSYSAQSSATAKTDTSKTSTLHPVTSIRVMDPVDESVAAASSMYAHGARDKNAGSVASLVTPLQKFAPPANQVDRLPVPFLQSKRNLAFWDVSDNDNFSLEAALAKRRRRLAPSTGPYDTSSNPDDTAARSQEKELLQTQQQEIQRLSQELLESKSTVERWETVNNKLMAKLQAQK